MFPRPGILRLLDQAQSRGLKTAICSAATKSSVEFVCEKLLGQSRVARLDCFLAGDDVKEKKPSPLIYETAAQRMGIRDKRACVVVEDSVIGLQVSEGKSQGRGGAGRSSVERARARTMSCHSMRCGNPGRSFRRHALRHHLHHLDGRRGLFGRRARLPQPRRGRERQRQRGGYRGDCQGGHKIGGGDSRGMNDR